jgi:hypothetical protein
MIVPDGRLEYDKLLELLGEPEENHLDFKAHVDLDEKGDQLKLVKDLVTLSNRPPGGYLLIGVDDDGTTLTWPQGTITDRRRFDGAKLGDLVRANIEAQINIRSQIHDHNGHEVVLIWVANTGLPVPFSKLGQYQDANGKVQPVFRPGDIFVREGAQNVPIRYAHWPDLLSAYTKRIRDEAGDLAQTVMREFIGQTRQHQPGEAAPIPLLMDMDEATFAAATVALLESGDDVRLRQFLRTFNANAGPAVTLDEFVQVLNKWTIFCAQALYFERGDLVDEAIDKLLDVYKKLGISDVDIRKRLAVVERIYVVGALAVRVEAWETVKSLALQPVPISVRDQGSTYSSWIRNAQVFATRADLGVDPEQPGRNRGGFILSGARELMVEHPAMRPDLTDAQVPAEEIEAGDAALNSLCEFDIAYCFIVAAMGTGRASAYPSSAAFDEDRAKPMAERIVANDDVRHRLFPGVDDATIARAIREMYEIAIRESANNYGGRWWDMPPRVREWVTQHSPTNS